MCRQIVKVIAFVELCGFFLVCSDAFAQPIPTLASTAATPKTKMESFTGATGVVSIKGYTTIGQVRQVGSVEVTAMSFRNAKSGQEQSGIAIEIQEHNRTAYARPARSFIDYDEIQGLVDGMDYIAKTQGDVTEHPFFEAKYSTKGDFSIVVFNDHTGQRHVSVTSGAIGPQSANMNLEKLAEFKSLVVRARATLDDPGAAKRAAAAAKLEQEAARVEHEQAGRALLQQKMKESSAAPSPTSSATPARSAQPKQPGTPKPVQINPPKQP